MSDEPSGSTADMTFGADLAWEVLRKAADRSDLDHSGAKLMRLGENALFHLPADEVVVRIARSLEYLPDVEKEVNVATWLEQLEFPAARLFHTSQPLDIAGHPVTFWSFIPGRDGDRRDIAKLGGVLQRLHTAPSPSTFSLPEPNIFARADRRIESASVPSADKDFLLHRLDELQAELPRLQYPLDQAPTHGDPHVKNLIISNDEAVLIDFEAFFSGQPEWDLATTATEFLTAKWWSQPEYDQFVDSYGFDVTSWSGFAVLRATNEFRMCTWLMQNVAESAEIAQEYQVRMRTLRGEPSTGWHPF